MTHTPTSPLFHTLPNGALDIIGDIHGEWVALQSLLHHLGYDEQGRHPQGRKLVFVGDLCDRGQDSPAVLDWVTQAMAAERAWAVLGNHELNLLMSDPKDGSGWYFQPRPQDEQRYAPWQHYPEQHKAALHAQLQQWPLLLQRADLRIIHAAWLPESLQQIADAGTMPLLAQYRHWEADFHSQFQRSEWHDAYHQEQQHFQAALEDESHPMAYLPATGAYDLLRSHANPIRALTCGVEIEAPAPFYANGRWRFTARSPWWHNYQQATPVLIGHYWRTWQTQPTPPHRLTLFTEAAQAWQGAQQSVFCLDYSVGARWRERRNGVPTSRSRFHLAAMRWPEQVLVRDDGTVSAAVR